MNAKVISFVNMKGGVGKTTLTINIGNELAKKGKRVLIVDMDPQFNATQSLLLYKTRLVNSGEANFDNEEVLVNQEIKSTEYYKELSNNKKTVLQLFEKTNIVEPLPNSGLDQKVSDNLYFIPGDLKVSKEIPGDNANKVGVLTKHFADNHILEKYDYIFIDCPPTWSILTHSSLFASDYYVIPSKVDLYSSIGIKLLEEQIDEKITNDTVYKMTGRKLKRLGVIFTLVHKKIKAEEDRMKYLKEEFRGDIEFFTSTFPHIPSISTKFIMIDEVRENSTYSELVNSAEKITDELISKI
ncbi:ParA family protein [Clostridium tyrobutyricum]|uniref:ParA family protein n=1 Tax=Clostridium tyrobutyricum TaxID=1519 RepID=UPI00057F397B|nr:ParA family protein [Clostridium tyrobutyricum]